MDKIRDTVYVLSYGIVFGIISGMLGFGLSFLSLIFFNIDVLNPFLWLSVTGSLGFLFGIINGIKKRRDNLKIHPVPGSRPRAWMLMLWFLVIIVCTFAVIFFIIGMSSLAP